MMMKSVQRILTGIFCFALLLITATPCIAYAAQGETVTVAYIDYNSFISRSDDGFYEGYAADYLKKIAEYTGWEYEFVDMDWPTAFEAVKEGRIDFYCVARQTDERQEDFDFSLYPLCNEEMNLYALPESELFYEDYEAFDGMKIGMLASSGEIDYFNQYARDNGFEYELKEYPLNEAAAEALRRGEVDAIALVNYSVVGDFKLVGNFGVSPAYLMSRDGSEYMDEFSKAQERLHFDDPDFANELQKTYYDDELPASNLRLTREEAEYIQSAPELTVALSRGLAPIEYYDEETRSFKGVTVDLFGRISDLTGLEFSFTARGDTPELRAQLESGEVDMVGAMAKDPSVAQALSLDQTAVFLESTFSMVAEDIDALTNESTAAVPAGYPMFADAVRRGGYVNLREYDTVEACIDAVHKGEADLTYIVSICEGYLLDHVKYQNLRSLILQNSGYGRCLGVSDLADARLLSIINKCLSVTPASEINELIVRNTAEAKPPQTLEDIIVKNRVGLTVAGIVLVTAVVFIATRTVKVRQRRDFDEKHRRHYTFLQHLYDTLPCGVFQYAYEAPHEILNYNAACAKIYGYDDGVFPVVGESPDVVVEVGTEAAFQETFVRCEKAGGPISYIWPVTRKDGSRAYTECVMDIVETEQGKVFQEVVVDVTARTLREKEIEKRYSQELQRRDMRDKGMLYLTCFDITEQILAETDIDAPGIYAGMSIAESMKVLSGELSALQTDDAMADLATRFAAERMEKEYANGEYEQSFLLCRVKDGQPQWLRSDLALRRNPNNDHLMCFDYIWDVTDEQITNEIIRHMAFADCERFMSVYLPTGRCLQYEVESAGALTRSEAQYGVSDMLCDIAERMSQADAQELKKATALSTVAERLDADARYQVYAILTDERGQRRDKALNFFYTNKEKGLLAVIVADVTQVRADEVRRAEILADALAAAERADIAKSQFLSRVSHEMRTPLNAIIGFMELAKGTDERTMSNYLANSDTAAKQLLNVINDVLDMSSIESGKLKIAHAPFDFRHLISSITNVYGAQCKQKGVSFEVQITAPIEDWLVGDELRVNQILMNLLGNAVKFTSEGSIRLTITKTEVGAEKVFLRFVVSDTGCGMSAEMLERLFTPFEQESAATARKHGGSGLGLSIVKSLVGMMDGMIRVDSKLGEGSVFTVDLPFTKSEVVSDTMQSGRVDHLRVLVVDDEESAREYMRTILDRMGVRHTCVDSGSEALVAMERSEREKDIFNVCLIDWRMPSPDGFETTGLIRKRYGEDVLLIVVSSYDFHQVGDTAMAAGANMLLSKPVFQSDLFDLFMTLTGGKIAKPPIEAQEWNFAGRRVLLAEDNELNQMVAIGYLEKCNVAVDLAGDGQSVVDKFLASEPGYYDAILMDVQMPVLDGFETTKAIRESDHPQAKTIAIIAQTANAFNEDIAKALSAGMNAHVAKPIDPETLYRTLAANMDSAETAISAEPLRADAPVPEMEKVMDRDALAAVGVDYVEGVKRFRGKSQMYEKYLLKFLDSDPLPSLLKQLQAGNGEEAFRITHDLKGATGNLCMTRLFETVCELTECLRSGGQGDSAASDNAIRLCRQAIEAFDAARKAACYI